MDGLELLMMRRQAGMRQFELAQCIGIHPSRLSEMERNLREIPQDLAEQITQALSVKVSVNQATR